MLDNEQQERQRQAAEILRTVYDMNPFALPSKMIDEQAEQAGQRQQQQMQQQGASEEEAREEVSRHTTRWANLAPECLRALLTDCLRF